MKALNLFLLLASLILSVNGISQSKYQSFSESQNPYLDTLQNDILSYKLSNLQIIPAEKLIRANAEIHLKRNEKSNTLEFDFHHTFKIQKITVNGAKAPFKLNSNNVLSINISGIKSADEYYTVSVTYYNTSDLKDLWDRCLSGQNFLFTNMPNSYLFPCIEYIGERATLDLSFVVPSDYEIVVFEEEINGGSNRNRMQFISSSRLTPNNLSIAILKNYSKFSSKQNGVLVTQYSPIDSTFIFKDKIKGIGEKIAFIEELLGSFPYKFFNIVITKGDYNRINKVGRDQIMLPFEYSLDETLSDGVLMNGLAQQWFGNKISVRYDEDLWLSEGISRYIEWLWIEKKVGHLEFNKMISAKYVEMEKYMGQRDWMSHNPKPFYNIDLHFTPIVNESSNNIVIQGKHLDLALDILFSRNNLLNREDSLSFKNEFKFELSKHSNKKVDFHKLVNWAVSRGPNKFEISLDSYYTLKALENNKPYIFKFNLLQKPQFKSPVEKEIYGNRAALMIHAIRINLGDEVFFREIKNLAQVKAGDKISTWEAIRMLSNMGPVENRERLKKILSEWIKNSDSLPSAY